MKKEKSDQNAVAELTREGLYKENKWLWEENKKLKEELEKWKYGNSLAFDDIERICNEKLQLEKENENLNDYWNITQRTMKDYEDMIDELNDKLNKIKDLFNKRDMTGKDEFLEELRDLLRD